MSAHLWIRQLVLGLFVIILGITVGGGLYETLVIMPVWTHSPPDSVLAYYHQNLAHPQFAINQGGQFWIYVTPLLGLLAVATLVTGLRTGAVHQRWRIVAAALTLVVVVFTFTWFVPNILVLMGEGVTRLDREAVTSLTNWWVRLNWVRVVFYVTAWLAALRALTLPCFRETAT
jgi:Domain of unknown function (DUF1772)